MQCRELFSSDFSAPQMTLHSLSELISSLTVSNSSTAHQEYQHASSSRTQVHLDSSSAIRDTNLSEVVSFVGASNSSVLHQDSQSSRAFQVDLVSPSASGDSGGVLFLRASNSSAVGQDNQHALLSRTSQLDPVPSETKIALKLFRLWEQATHRLLMRNMYYCREPPKLILVLPVPPDARVCLNLFRL